MACSSGDETVHQAGEKKEVSLVFRREPNRMNSNPISGIFTVKSDQDGDWYEVAFKPDHEQIWSAQATGFIAKFTEIDALYHVERIVGAGKHPELVKARTEGVVHFLGHLSRDTYLSYSPLKST
jgi:hypothetical protein